MGISSQLNFLQGDYVIIIESWMIYTAIFLISIIILFLSRKIIRKIIDRKRFFDHVVFLVRLPKEKNKEEMEKDYRLEQLYEEIGKGETVFSCIGGLKAQKGFKAWLLGRDDHFAFEIVASEKKIAFYVTAPRLSARYIEQQIQAHYPDATIEEVEDYNIFSPKSEVMATTLKTRYHFIFPIKTYKKNETDPMDSLINVLSKIQNNEGLAIQFIVRSARLKWHRKVIEIVRKARSFNSIERAINYSLFNRFLHFLNDVIRISRPPDSNNSNTIKTLTQKEEEVLKNFEEKNAKAGLDVNIRLVASAQNKEQVQIYLNNIANAFNQYNYYEYGNSFPSSISLRNQTDIIKNFIYRRFDESKQFLLNTEEMASLFHFPLKDSKTPNIMWLSAKYAPAPANTPNTGIFLGNNVYRGVIKPVHFKPEDRLRHTYIIGKSGGGKSQFIANMATQDILNGDGVCVLDPHGDLIEDILQRIPPERAEDVIVFSPGDLERPLGLNLLEYDPKYPEQKSFAINEMIGIFDKLYDLKSTGGPMFELYMRNAMLLVMSDPDTGSTLMEIPKVLADANFRAMKLKNCPDQTVIDFWKKEAEKAGGDAALENIVPYITSKLTQFISNDMMRPIIAQQKSAINFREVMDNQKIILIDLPKGAIGEMNAYLLGMIIIGKILIAALSRADMPKEKRKNFYLYIDEFQNFTTNSIAQILSESRKYGLGLILAHQYIGQLTKNNDPTIKNAVFGNVGTMMCFRIGAEDGEFLEKEFAPIFNQFDLLNIEMFTLYCKLLIDNSASKSFSLKAPWPIAGGEPSSESAKRIRALSRLKFGRHREVIEAEIERRRVV